MGAAQAELPRAYELPPPGYRDIPHNLMEDQRHGIDPIETILARAAENPEATESHTLVKAVLSAIRNQDDVSVGELCALSAEALALMHAFVQGCMAGRYERSFLDSVAASLVSRQNRNFRPVRKAA